MRQTVSGNNQFTIRLAVISQRRTAGSPLPEAPLMAYEGFNLSCLNLRSLRW
jgi:hypothetical protein